MYACVCARKGGGRGLVQLATIPCMQVYMCVYNSHDHANNELPA